MPNALSSISQVWLEPSYTQTQYAQEQTGQDRLAAEKKGESRGNHQAQHARKTPDRSRALYRPASRLGAAGAIEGSGDLLGLTIFKPVPIKDAQRLLHDDPAVQAGVLRSEFHIWWSSDHVLPR
jgi:hypothetical protein